MILFLKIRNTEIAAIPVSIGVRYQLPGAGIKYIDSVLMIPHPGLNI
jgi:hypothetical protein